MSLIIVLIGPPGSGKTHCGYLLASSLGFAFSETERDLVDRHGSRESFLENKRSALAKLEQELRSRAESSEVPIVIESTGLSDRPMLDRLRSDFTVLLVKVWAPRAQCVDRVRSREPGRNLSNDPEEAARFHRFWVREVAPGYEFDLEWVNDGRSEAEMIQAVSDLVAQCGEERRSTS